MTQPSSHLGQDTVTKFGIYLLAFATIAAGILDLVWGEFEAAHQPIGALGDNIPGQTIFAYITALWLIATGAALLWRRTVRTGALAAIIIYLIFGLFWLPRLYTAPHALGWHAAVIIGVLAGMFTQLIVVAGVWVLYSSLSENGSIAVLKSSTVSRYVIGLGAVSFGLAHMTAVQLVARMVPDWVPLGGPFWVVVSGIAFLAAGLAIITGVLKSLAAHLLALLLIVFEFPVLLPLIIASPHNHVAWGASAYNLAAAGALCIFAASTGTPRFEVRTQSAKMENVVSS